MILLDTHIWIWLNNDMSKIPDKQLAVIDEHIDDLAIHAISCWEICKLVELGRLQLGNPLKKWFDKAFSFHGLSVIDLTLDISIESTSLPGKFHRDPMDQIIVATARIYDCLLLTIDNKILDYPHVTTLQ